jgi:PAS domain S-box-containing protein
VIRDITVRKEAALELFQVQQMIRLVLDTVPQRIFWKDRNLRFLGCNRSFAADAGYQDPQQIIGLDDHALSWKATADLYQSNDNWVMENDQAKLDFEEPQKREDGTIRWLKTSLVPLHDEASQVVGMLGTYEDITDRKLSEKALRLSDAAVASAQSPIAISDLAGILTKINRAFLEVWGYTDPEEVLGRSVVEFWQTGDQAAIVVTQLQQTGGWSGELEACRKDGSQLLVQVSASMIADSEGQVTGMMASFLDITERKRLEEELAKKVEELARSNAELEQFAYVASHDLQEPLRMISSYVQLLARRYQGALGTEADEFIHYAVDGATRMQALIQDLLAYSRVGGSGIKLVPVDCEEVLRQTLMDMRVSIEEAGATITHDSLPVIRFDPVQFAQILQNLIGNAIKFRRPEEPLIVALAAVQHGEEWLFSVKDNGLGVSDQFKKKAFQLFQRWQARGESAGTGIGLPVCRKIVEYHGGRIWVESAAGEGSTFYFTIPLKPRTPIRVT